jgi:hypothetical protein
MKRGRYILLMAALFYAGLRLGVLLHHLLNGAPP